ncbi:MAG: ISAzo13-like element transposase-related protein [Rhizobium sp.]|uniref:ISAzo13-like element transposase-related protein n=1 Tax=Rhizobium sp. TaxID=391 RepID=UPI00389A6511
MRRPPQANRGSGQAAPFPPDRSADSRRKAPPSVKVRDFGCQALGKWRPTGVNDVAANGGFVSVGITARTTEFVVTETARGASALECGRYPHARRRDGEPQHRWRPLPPQRNYTIKPRQLP